MKIEKLQLSVVILTNLKGSRFIKSLESAQFADQVVVIDYESQNDWQSLKELYHFELWQRNCHTIRNFADERNQALEKAKHSWVLFLDSDEVILPKSFKLIKEIIEKNDCDGATVKRLDLFLGKVLVHGETNRVKLLRLFKKNRGHWLRPVHEFVRVNGVIKNTNITFLHNSHQNFSDFISKINHYTDIEADFRCQLFKIKLQKNNHQKNKRLFLASNYFQMVIFPLVKFLQNYFIRLGIFDGWRGLIYATAMSLHSLVVRIKVIEKMRV
ncbi:MAG: glycosyltransferase family 2 protein [Patescibacteria group bacterium]